MFAFTKSQRLLHKREYNQVFEAARKVATSDYILLYRENALGYPRLGLAISKKKIAKAHDRNRIKRILREAFRKSQLPAVDLVFLAKSGWEKQANAVIYEKLGKTWEQLIRSYAK